MGLTRQELFSRLQLIRIMEPLTTEAMKSAEDHYWRSGEDNSPHGRPWHTSFHASSFPGDSDMACPRAALYTLLDIPKDEPFKPRGRMFMEQGKAIENVIVTGFYHQGILLSPPPWEPVQLGITDPEVWLTGNTDAVILHTQLGRPHVVECKARQQKVLTAMRVGLRGPDDHHVHQAKTYVAAMHILSKKMWPKLPQLRDGSILYVSMDDPAITAEFFVDYDPDFYEAGLAQLKQWKEWFTKDVLPSTTTTPEVFPPVKGRSKHPLGWRWTYPPCNWCDFGKTCRKDHADDVEKLSESHGIDFAESIRDDYDHKEIRKAVFAAWEDA